MSLNLMKVRLSNLVSLAMALPFIGLISCISLSIWYHWEETTATHCKVNNWLPTISSSVGRKPEAYVWRFTIGLHSSFRYLFTFTYYQFYLPSLAKVATSYYLVLFNCLLSSIENTCLLVLTCVSSTENYDIHKFGFISFLICSSLYMLVSCFLFWKLGCHVYNNKNKTSFRMKITLVSCYFFFLLLAMYFFWRHNTYCEPGVYSWFAFCEYIVVITNILFHGTAKYDFSDTVIESF